MSFIAVRYFSGTLLGVPGLIQAYKSSAALVLQLVPIIQKPIEVMYEHHFDNTQMNEAMMIVKLAGCRVSAQEKQLFCLLKMGVPKAKLEEVLPRLKEKEKIEIIRC